MELSMKERGVQAKTAGIMLSDTSTAQRNNALKDIAIALDKNRAALIEANAIDCKKAKLDQLGAPILKRLTFDNHKIDEVISGINSLIDLDDPLGKTTMDTELDNGLNLYRITTALGVVGIIFESRPDAFVQISTLCLKSGNAVLMKGGKEAINTNRALYHIIRDATMKEAIPKGWIQNLESREEVGEMLALSDYIDLIIPRGSNEFVKYIMDHSNIPVMGHSDGICHVYVDADADLTKAYDIVVDSKTQYIAACNTLETLLVSKTIAQEFLSKLKELLDEKGVKLVGDRDASKIMNIDAATEDDWKTEYLDLKLSIKIVNSLEEAIDHINTYGSGHTDSIITENANHIKKFTTLVDSACVFVNCSTRFSDGFRFGFGAEVGISTSKIHARGPVGLEGLLSYKYTLIGHGDIVKPYAEGNKTFTHKSKKI